MGPLPIDFSSPSVSVPCHERALLWPDIVSQVHAPSSTQSYAPVSEVTEQLSISEDSGSPGNSVDALEVDSDRSLLTDPGTFLHVTVNADAIELQAFLSDIAMHEDEFGVRIRPHHFDKRCTKPSYHWFRIVVSPISPIRRTDTCY